MQLDDLSTVVPHYSLTAYCYLTTTSLPYYLTTTLLAGVQLDHNERRGGLLVLLPQGE